MTCVRTLSILCFAFSTISIFSDKVSALNYDIYQHNVIAQSSSQNTLTKEIWNELVYKNRQRKIASNNKRTLSYSEVRAIIGFAPSKHKNGKYTWIDASDNNKIIVRFHDKKIMDMKSIGFNR